MLILSTSPLASISFSYPKCHDLYLEKEGTDARTFNSVFIVIVLEKAGAGFASLHPVFRSHVFNHRAALEIKWKCWLNNYYKEVCSWLSNIPKMQLDLLQLFLINSFNLSKSSGVYSWLTHISLWKTTAIFSLHTQGDMLVAWNGPQWGYFHDENWQRTLAKGLLFFSPTEPVIKCLQCTTKKTTLGGSYWGCCLHF